MRWHGGTLKKYPRQVEAKNGPAPDHYYYAALTGNAVLVFGEF